MGIVKPLTLCALLFIACPAAAVAPHPAASRRVDRLVATEMRRQRIPGLALAVIKDGRIVKAAGYGVANLEHHSPVTPQTIFPIASLDKQITATAVMMLVEENRLKLDDHLKRYYPGAPDAWKDITVRHLLTHTAGLKDEYAEEVGGRLFAEYTDEQTLDYIARLPLDFSPGDKWQYSDAGFILLQVVVEKVSGAPWPRFFAERIFKPLGMNRAYVLNPRDVFPDRATSYLIDDRNRLRASQLRMIDFHSYNDIGATVLDFAKWDQAMDARRLVKQSSLDLMWTPARLNDGAAVRRYEHSGTLFNSAQSYGFGWMLANFRGHRMVVHTGYTGACIFRLPDDRLTVIVFANLDIPSGSDPRSVAREVAGIYLPAISWTHLKEKPDPAPAVTRWLKEEFARLGAGRPELRRYAPAFGSLLGERTQALRAATERLGTLESLAFLDGRNEERGRELYYRADYERGALFLTITLNREGLIEFIQIERGQ